MFGPLTPFVPLLSAHADVFADFCINVFIGCINGKTPYASIMDQILNKVKSLIDPMGIAEKGEQIAEVVDDMHAVVQGDLGTIEYEEHVLPKIDVHIKEVPDDWYLS